jgi:hypothetical protein
VRGNSVLQIAESSSARDQSKSHHSFRGPALLIADRDFPLLPKHICCETLNVVKVSHVNSSAIFALVTPDGDVPTEIQAFDVCAAAAFTKEGKDVLDTLAKTTNATVQKTQPFSIVEIELGNEATAVSSAIQRGCIALLSEMAMRNALLSLSLAAVRGEHETLQESFLVLEQSLSSLGTREKVVFETPVASAHVTVDGGGIVQRFPISSTALSCVELYVVVEGRGLDGTMEVRLATLEDGQAVGQWRVPLAGLGSGWKRLALRRSLMGRAKTVELTVRGLVKSGPQLRLALSHPTPIDDANYRTSSGEWGQSPLALRIWRGLPNAGNGPALRGDAGSLAGSIAVCRLPPEILAAHEPMGDDSGELVKYIAEVEEIQVHPRPRRVVCARLPEAILRGTRRISATVVTRHNEAPPIDYALLTVTGRRQAIWALRRATSLAGPAENFSGWHTVLPSHPTRINLTLSEVPTKAGDLLLLTRSAYPNNTSYAWARFADIEIELDGLEGPRRDNTWWDHGHTLFGTVRSDR